MTSKSLEPNYVVDILCQKIKCVKAFFKTVDWEICFFE